MPSCARKGGYRGKSAKGTAKVVIPQRLANKKNILTKVLIEFRSVDLFTEINKNTIIERK